MVEESTSSVPVPLLCLTSKICAEHYWAQAQARHERFARNSAWLQRHATEIYTHYRGKCICVAGEELFVADTPEEVLAQARTAHPEEQGSILIRYIPREKVARIYAY